MFEDDSSEEDSKKPAAIDSTTKIPFTGALPDGVVRLFIYALE